jgi:hypothetical protein
LRERAFELAGLTPEVVAKQLERAISVYLEGMEATRTETVSYHGEIVSQTEVVDHATRIRAAEGWASLTGVSASKASLGGQQGPPQVSISLNVPFLADLEITRDVTPPTDVEMQDEQQ